MRFKALGVVVVAALVVAGCSSKSSDTRGGATPDDVVKTVYQLCQDKQYSKAADYWVDGPEWWANDPGVVRNTVDRVCDRQRVAGWAIVKKDIQDGAAFLSTEDWRADDPTKWPREWEMVQRSGRWLIVRTS